MFVVPNLALLISAIIISIICFLFLVLRCPYLSRKKKKYKIRRQETYQSIANQINNEYYISRGFQIIVGQAGDWLEITSDLKKKGVHNRRATDQKKENFKDNVDPVQKVEGHFQDIGDLETIEGNKNHEIKQVTELGFVKQQRQNDEYYETNHSERKDNYTGNYNDVNEANVFKYDTTLRTVSTAEKSPNQKKNQSSPYNNGQSQYQSYIVGPGLFASGHQVDLNELRMSRISALKKPNLKPFNEFNLNSIEEEDQSQEQDGQYKLDRNPSNYYFTYKDRIINADAQDNRIYSSPNRVAKRIGYLANENTNPNSSYRVENETKGNQYGGPKIARQMSLVRYPQVGDNRPQPQAVFINNNTNARNRNLINRNDIVEYPVQQNFVTNQMGYR